MPRIQNIAANVLNSCRRLNPNIGFCPPHRLPALTTIATMIFGICMLQRALALSTPNAASKAALGARCPLLAASSTGRCNTGVKSLRWGFKLQGLTWSFIELTRHLIQISLRVHRQVSSLRKVLSQQTIGVLVGTALPRTLRIAEVNVDIGRQRKSSMIRKLLAPVPGQR